MSIPSEAKVRKFKESLDPRLFAEFSNQHQSEPRGLFTCPEGMLLVPSTTRDVTEIVFHANAIGIPVIPYGGGTGLVGGQIYTGPEIPAVVSLHKLNRLRDISTADHTVTVEAGCVLQNLQEEVEKTDNLFPLSIASKGSCQIGGNLATNAGGVHVIRYGNARELCLGLEVVLPDGSLMNTLNRLHKNNHGLDLKNLMIGSEGTLGIITAATMKIYPRPKEVATAILSVPDLARAIELLNFFQANFGRLISAFELISEASLQFVRDTGLVTRLPFDMLPRWAVLVELGTEFEMELNDRLLEVSSQALTRNLIVDGVFAHSDQQRLDFWNLRELIPEANRIIGALVSNDISVPISRIPIFIEQTNAAIAKIGGLTTNCFGHIGDGNLHYNVFDLAKRNKDTPALKNKIKETVYSMVNELEGSTSAEHGTGRLRINELERFGDKAYVDLIRKIKQSFDPNNIMNPGALFR